MELGIFSSLLLVLCLRFKLQQTRRFIICSTCWVKLLTQLFLALYFNKLNIFDCLIVLQITTHYIMSRQIPYISLKTKNLIGFRLWIYRCSSKTSPLGLRDVLLQHRCVLSPVITSNSQTCFGWSRSSDCNNVCRPEWPL